MLILIITDPEVLKERLNAVKPVDQLTGTAGTFATMRHIFLIKQSLGLTGFLWYSVFSTRLVRIKKEDNPLLKPLILATS